MTPFQKACLCLLALTFAGVLAILGVVIADGVIASSTPTCSGNNRMVTKSIGVGGATKGRGHLTNLQLPRDEGQPDPARAWPFPNAITQGTGSAWVARGLRPSDIQGPGARNLAASVVDDFNAFTGLASGNQGAPGAIVITVTITGQQKGFSMAAADQAYTITATAQGVQVTAATATGAVYALQTLQQLIRQGRLEGLPLSIQDSPKVAYRALMLDCSRHFLPLATLLDQVRIMAFHKLNVLHLHLTDGQSFPLALGPHTRAVSLGSHAGNTGAYSSAQVYTAADVEALVQYAAQRGVAIVPEVDTPGHSYSWISGHPDCMTCADLASQQQAVCPEPPCGFFNLQDRMTQVQSVVAGVLGEVVTAFRVGKAGFSPYLHLGFDEVGCPARDPSGGCVQPSCTKAYGALAVQYGNWLLGWAKATLPASAQVIMWVDQVLTSNFGSDGTYQDVLHVDPAFVLLHFWSLSPNTPQQLAALAARGFKLINSQSTTYYLDAGGEGNGVFWGGALGNVAHGSGSSAGSAGSGGPSVSVQYQKYWMATYPGVTGILTSGWPTSWEDIYQNNIAWLPTTIGAGTAGTAGYQFIAVTDGEASHGGGIVGACCCAWGEQIDYTNIDTRVWPKASAMAEALWRYSVDRMADNVPHARLRLAFTREDLLRLGVRAAPIMSADVLRSAPWGSLGPGSPTSLMYDVNQDEPQVPTGYAFAFQRWWGAATTCGTPAANPFCGPLVSSRVSCTNPSSAPFVQQGCAYPPAVHGAHGSSP